MELGVGETPLIGEEHLPSKSQTLENLECLTENVAFWDSKPPKGIAAVLPKSGHGRPGLWRLQLGTLAVVNLSQLKVVSHTLCRKGPIKNVGSVWLD